jgi:hypothetical protein
MTSEVRTNITKEEAARRQIETAITLFFFEGDEVSIHVLASSAAQILSDVCKKKGIVGFRASLADNIRPEYQVRVARKLKEAYNYFKHADQDTFDELQHFNPASNDILLFACCDDFAKAFVWPLPPILMVFFMWFIAANPDCLKEDFPHRETFDQAFATYRFMGPDEQRRAGRTLLQDYLNSRGEVLPIKDL